MAKRILVPLDGHEAGEAITPIVAALASESGASVRLLHVARIPELVVGPYGRTVAYVDQQMARVTEDTLRDLTHIEAQFVGVPVESTVRFGDPVEEILLEAEAFDADLIALATSRRSRLSTVFATGVAEQVVRKASIPALVLRG
jgi:nucleotide-binding universal stress UspA family protein